MGSEKPYVIAGLVAALGVSAVLVAPDVAFAGDTLAAAASQPAAISAEAGSDADQGAAGDQAVVSDQAVDHATDEGSGKVADTVDDTGEGEAAAADEAADETGAGAAADKAGEAAAADRADASGESDGAADKDGADVAADKAGEAGATDKADASGKAASAGAATSAAAANADAAAADALGAQTAAAAQHRSEWVQAADGTYSWYGDDGKALGSGWVVTDKGLDNKKTSLQRYWIKLSGVLAVSELVDTGDYWAYATAAGYVVRGKYSVKAADGSTLVYLADNDGRLEGPGWHVSSAYGDGLQRYYVESSTRSARVGFSESGYAHYTTDKGYVLRGAGTFAGGMYYADNDGRLAGSGWLVTSAFGQGLQRYWMEGGRVASEGVHQTGGASWTYSTSYGYVLRGKFDSGDGHVFVSDNDGMLLSTVDGQSGWVVTTRYDGSFQRYWFDADSHAALTGSFFADDSYHWGIGGQGYVLRGALVAPYFCFADNDGIIFDGWVVSSSYGQGLQRYWQSGGRFVSNQLISETDAGWWAFAESDCRVVRGKYAATDGTVYLADNDGKLEDPGWHVTTAYGDGLQRYWVDEDAHGCKPGFFTVEDSDYYTLPGKGWVLRGSETIEGRTWYADNDGRIFTPIVASAAVKKSGDATNIESTVVGGTVYLFLPSYATLSSVPLAALRWNGLADFYLGAAEGTAYKNIASFEAVDLESLSSQKLSNGALLFSYKLGELSPARRLAVMLSSDVTSVFVLSKDRANNGRDYVEASPTHTAKADVAVVVVASDGTVLYNKDDVSSGKTSTIKGRGNSTWGIGNKKPYQISLNKKADLLQTGKSENEKKKWVLLANSNDVTLLHNTIAYNLALELGLVGTECTAADLWYDGEYRGSYLLCEKVEVNSGRVDIFDLEGAFEDANSDKDLDSLPTAKGVNKYGYEFQYVQGVANPEDYSGGYLLELDNAYYYNEKCWFKTRSGCFVVKSPEVCSYDAIKYISEALGGAMGWLEGQGGAAYTFDMDSLAKALLVNEYLKNVDYGTSSTYFYLDRGYSQFVASPVWDFDGGVGLRSDVLPSQGEFRFINYHGYMDSNEHWMIKNVKVQTEIKSLWNTSLSALLNNVLLGDEDAIGANGYLHSLKYYVNQVAASQKMNEVLFGLSYFRNEFKPFSTYERNIQYLTDWLTWRSEWFEDNLKLLNGSAQGISTVADGLDYSLVFDASYYKKMNPDVVAVLGVSDEAAFNHFMTYGMSEGRVASRNFDVKAYALRYADLRQAFGNDYKAYYRHYLTWGFYEGRFA